MQSVSMLQRPKGFTGMSLTSHRPSLPRAGRLAAKPVARQSQKPSDTEPQAEQKPAPLAATLALAACLMMGSALLPQDALAARSSGRMGGSSGFRSAPRSAPSRPSRPAPSPGPMRSGPTYNNYNMTGPSLGGYGGGYGYGGGISLFPSFTPVYGIGGGGGFFNIIAGLFVFSTVASLVRGIFRRRNNDDE